MNGTNLSYKIAKSRNQPWKHFALMKSEETPCIVDFQSLEGGLE